jgi:hypothetical protein
MPIVASSRPPTLEVAQATIPRSTRPIDARYPGPSLSRPRWPGTNLGRGRRREVAEHLRARNIAISGDARGATLNSDDPRPATTDGNLISAGWLSGQVTCRTAPS